MEDSKTRNGNDAKPKEAIVVSITWGILIVIVALFSGCVIRPTPGEPSNDVAAGQTRSVIYVPVLILPPSDDGQYDRDERPGPGPLPPVEIIRDRQKMARPQASQAMVCPRFQTPSARREKNAAGNYKTKPKPEL